MTDYFVYLAKSSVLMGLLYGLYHLLLRKEAFYSGNRFFLLAALVIPLFAPLLKLSMPVSENSTAATYLLDTLTISAAANTAVTSSAAEPTGLQWIKLLFWMYWGGVILTAGFFAIRIARICRFICTHYPVYHVCNTPVKMVPGSEHAFSFFGQIFLGDRISAESRHTIVKHELIHASRYHSADKLLAELVQVMFWFNPIVYLIKRELTAVNEYAADYDMISEYSPGYYRKILLRQANLETYILSNAFNQSLTLKRLIMLQKEKFHKTAKKRFFGALILAVFFITPFACSDISQEEMAKKEPSKKSADKKEVNAVEHKSDSQQKSAEQEIFNVVEQMPEFPGGSDSLRSYLAKNVKYPAEAREKVREGKVYVRFVITKTGQVGKVQLARGVSPSLNREAMHVIKNMPKWKPGKHNGDEVNVRYVVPINFSLPDNENESQ